MESFVFCETLRVLSELFDFNFACSRPSAVIIFSANSFYCAYSYSGNGYCALDNHYNFRYNGIN